MPDLKVIGFKNSADIKTAAGRKMHWVNPQVKTILGDDKDRVTVTLLSEPNADEVNISLGKYSQIKHFLGAEAPEVFASSDSIFIFINAGKIGKFVLPVRVEQMTVPFNRVVGALNGEDTLVLFQKDGRLIIDKLSRLTDDKDLVTTAIKAPNLIDNGLEGLVREADLRTKRAAA